MPTILLADDDPMQHELVEATLGPAHRTLHAWNGREALDLARRERPHLVLLDVTMAELDGFEVCRQLKADPSTREIIVVMLSGRAEVRDQERGVEVGADVYITKPFRPSVLLDTVGRALGNDQVPQPLRPRLLAEAERPTDQSAELAQTLAYARDLSALYEAARERAARFRLLVELGKDLVAARGLDALLQLALERAPAFSGHDGGSVLLFAGPDGPLEVRAAGGADPAELGTRVEDLATSVAGLSLHEQRPLILEGHAADIGTAWRKYTRLIPSAICLPLITPGGQPIGVLALKSTMRPLHLDEHDLDALQLLAAQLAAAVESVRLHERLQRSLDALLAIHEAGQVLSATLEAEEIGRRLLDIVGRVPGVEAAVIRLRNAREQLPVWQAAGSEGLWRCARGMPANRAARRAALTRGEPRVFRLSRPTPATEPLVGWCLPLRGQDRVIGVLEAYGSEALASEATAEILGSLANQAASALENARLYRELGEREQRLEELVARLAERERRLEDLVARLLVAQEEERRRVAYDVHDGVAQVAAGTHQVLQAFAYEHRPDSPAAQEQLQRAVELARRKVREARRVIADLRPTALDDFGLATALRLQIEGLRGEGWQITYDEALGAERLPPALETALFRVAQEALANVRKHAGTMRAHLALERHERTVRLEVQDWGRGFRLSQARAGAGPGERVGLPGMQERIALLGGRCSVRSHPGVGTRVVAEVPLPARSEGGENDGR